MVPGSTGEDDKHLLQWLITTEYNKHPHQNLLGMSFPIPVSSPFFLYFFFKETLLIDGSVGEFINDE